MKKMLIAANIDFADSTFKSYEHVGNDLYIWLISWDEQLIKIEFSNCIGFSYMLGDFIDNLYQTPNGSCFFEKVLGEKYGNVPKDHPFRLFQLIDISDFPFMEIAADSVSVKKLMG